jgi:1-acyl-sn-glycerol-3-phosphate acyltransferase
MSTKRSFEFSAFLRGLFLILSAAIFTAILFPPAFVSCFLDSSGRWPSLFQRAWVLWLLRANGIRLRLRGLENLNGHRSFIIVSNHASILDIPAIIAAFPFPVRFVAKKSLAGLPFFGWFLYAAGYVLIDRKNPSSILKSLKGAHTLLEKGISVIVFPEGTRTATGEVQEFKKGGFLLAVQSRTPLVPVSIFGTFSMLPRTGWCFWPGEIELTIRPPLTTQGIHIRDLPPFMAKVREGIIQGLKTETMGS